MKLTRMAVLALGFGAGATYFFDRERGRARRQMALERGGALARKAGQQVQRHTHNMSADVEGLRVAARKA